MPLQLSWKIEGKTELSRVLRNIGEGIKDWTPAFHESAEELKKIFSNDVFSSEGSVIGMPWEPLKPSYLAQKTKAGFPSATLIKTGAMKASFQSLYKADFAEVWNSSVYFKYHQSDAPRSKLPRRAMMKLGENQKQLVVKVFHTYWYKKVNGKL